ncbi:MAG: hypothetical protein QW356_06850, partial [Candidatus Hadarchaeales archaeon]
VERMVAIICYHPMLKLELSQLLQGLKIKHVIKPDGLFIRRKDGIITFSKLVGFLKNVKISRNSKYWGRIEKNEILKKIVSSYDKKFHSKRRKNIIEEIKNL